MTSMCSSPEGAADQHTEEGLDPDAAAAAAGVIEGGGRGAGQQDEEEALLLRLLATSPVQQQREGDDDDDAEGPGGRGGAAPPTTAEGGGGLPCIDEKEAKKLRKKQAKAARRAKREGRAGLGLKPCHVCGREVELLVRCQTDDSLQWRMVCGRCWRDVSGGVVDGDAAHPHYRYGGLWKAK